MEPKKSQSNEGEVQEQNEDNSETLSIPSSFPPIDEDLFCSEEDEENQAVQLPSSIDISDDVETERRVETEEDSGSVQSYAPFSSSSSSDDEMAFKGQEAIPQKEKTLRRRPGRPKKYTEAMRIVIR